MSDNSISKSINKIASKKVFLCESSSKFAIYIRNCDNKFTSVKKYNLVKENSHFIALVHIQY